MRHPSALQEPEDPVVHAQAPGTEVTISGSNQELQ